MTQRTHQVLTDRGAYDWRRPDLSELTLEEVATALSRIHRFQGSSPVTVAEHSVAMARAASSDDVARSALFHDGHEMFLSDLPSPMRELSWVRNNWPPAEERFDKAMEERFDVRLVPMRPSVKRLDKRSLRSEVEAFLPHALPVAQRWSPLPEPMEGWSPARAKREWLAEARRLGLS